MYLKKLYIENNGPIRQLKVDMPFKEDGVPKPLILVGQNGSGKTNLLSIIADAIFQAACTHYTDLLPGTTRTEKPFFRVVGGSLLTLGTQGGFSILQFEDNGSKFLFKEKMGKISTAEATPKLDEDMRSGAQWPDEGNIKEFSITPEQAEKIFEKDVFAFFPSNRFEVPNWLNEEKAPDKANGFDLSQKYQGRLKKPLYVSNCLPEFQQWLLSLIMDARADVGVSADEGSAKFVLTGNIGLSLLAQQNLQLANYVLQQVLGNASARFAWLGRHGQKLGVASNAEVLVPKLSALSSGQLTLLSIFGTLIRYADKTSNGVIRSDQIAGICLIDEVDAHMHIDLQYRALPKLIKLFPKVQFILSSHSPLFALGMDKIFGTDNVVIVDLPSGITIQAEDYGEFGRALDIFQETSTYAKTVSEAVKVDGKPLVFLEGETDPRYIMAAAKALRRDSLLDQIDLQWIGAKNPENGQGVNTGKTALNAAYSFLCSNPNCVKRKVLLLYDNDANKISIDREGVFVRSLEKNMDHKFIKAGIENLLPASEELFSSGMYDKKDVVHPNGTRNSIEELNKMRLCEYVCTHCEDKETFKNFSSLLDAIESVFGLASLIESTINTPSQAAVC